MNKQIKKTAIVILLTLSLGYWLGLQQDQSPQHLSNKNTNNQPLAEQSHLPSSTREEYHIPSSTSNNSVPATPSPFGQLLKAAKYAEAINTYQETWSISEDEADKLRQQFIEHLEQLVTQHSISSASRIENALSSYLADFYDDIDIILLKVLHQSKQGFYYDALDTLLLAKTYAYTVEQQQQVDTTYHQLLSAVDKHLIAQNNPTELISLYLHAEVNGLLTDENQFRLVTLYLGNDNALQANHYADALKDNPLWEEKITAIMPEQKTIETSDDSQNSHTGSTITLTKVAHQFVVDTLLSNVNAPLLIDTGASITTITEAFYSSIKRKSNLRFQSKQIFNTANGETTGNIYLADTFSIGEYTLRDVEIAVLDYPSSKYSKGLLGMNVLRNFTFEIDQQNNLLKLSPIETTH